MFDGSEVLVTLLKLIVLEFNFTKIITSKIQFVIDTGNKRINDG